MGAYKELKRSLKLVGFSHDKLLYSKKVGRCSLVLYELGVTSYLVLYYKKMVIMTSIQADIAEFDMDLISIKNDPYIPNKLKEDFLNKVYKISEYLMNDIWAK